MFYTIRKIKVFSLHFSLCQYQEIDTDIKKNMYLFKNTTLRKKKYMIMHLEMYHRDVIFFRSGRVLLYFSRFIEHIRK